MEHGGLDIMETRQTEACYNNRRVYVMRGAAERISRAGVSQDGVGVGSQDRPNGWGSKSTRFHGTNVVSCEIVWKVSAVDPG